MKHLLLLGPLFVLSACQGSPPPTTDDQLQLERAEALLQDDVDAALTAVDALLARHPDWRAARLLLGEGSLRLAADPARSNRDALLQDAVAAFAAAAAAGPADAHCLLRLGDAQLQAGLLPESAATAAQALELLPATAAAQDQRAEAQRLAAEATMQQFLQLRRQELKDGERQPNGLVKPERQTAELAATAMTWLKQPELAAKTPSYGYRQAAQLLFWLDQPAAALQELENGVRQQPADADLHLELQAQYQRLDQLRALGGVYARLVKGQPATPILRWYQGRAQVMLADQRRQKGAWQEAIDGYRQARAGFGEYAAMQPGHAAAAAEWQAILDLALAATLTEVGDLAGAREHLFASDAVGAERLCGSDGRAPLADSFGNGYAQVAFAIGRALVQGGDDRLRRGLDFYVELLRRHPETWGWAYNNAGLAARDLGVQVEAAAAKADAAAQQRAHGEAMALWEQSYGFYEVASRLSPDDPRIVNDCGLMLVYHLRRDLDRARQLFLRAIEIGQPQLDALPGDAPAADRNFLEEAIGDAWQNLAVLASEHLHQPYAEYRGYCEKALEFYPKRQRTEVLKLMAAGEREAAQAPAGKGGPRAGPAMFAAVQGGEREAFEKLHKAAAPQAAAGDYDGALATLDKGIKQLDAYAPFRALRGEYSLALARQAREQKRKNVEFLFADAQRELERAVELDADAVAPRRLLSEAQLDNGDFAGAAATASRLLLHLQSLGGGDAEQLDAVHALRARAAARVVADAGGNGKDDELQEARLSFRHLEQCSKLDPAMLQLWSTMEQWAKKPAEAVNVWARAVAKAPDDTALLSGLCDTARSTGELEPAIAALQARTDALGVWYLGGCLFAQACKQRLATDNQAALATLDRAIACFEKSMAQNQGYAATCQQWLAWCYGKKGCAALALDDFAHAEQWLLESARRKPEEIGTDLGLNDNTKVGILLLAEHFDKAKDQQHVVQLFRKAAEAASGDVDLLNNAGLSARDYGNRIERQDPAAARELYEWSYQAYSRAQQLDPQNAQLCNDTALMLIYHLERDWEHAKALLDQGIQSGEKQLRESPPQDREALNRLDMAVGDSYENLALWHLKHSGDLAAARKAAEQSLQHYPGRQRGGAQRHLREIERRQQGK